MDSYNAFHKKIQSYWLSEHPEMVLESLKEDMGLYPKHKSELLFEGIMACIDLGLVSEAINMMKVADGSGFWYPKEMFPDDDIYKSFLDKWEKKRSSVSTTALEVGHEGAVNMLALHGWGEDLHLFRRYFNSDSFEKRGRIHYLQSSQQVGCIQYVWSDRKQAEKDVRHYLCDAFGDVKIDVLGGFSQGGYLALDLVVHGSIQVKKLVLLCPGKEEYKLEILKNLSEQGVEVLLISGSNDYEHVYHNSLYENLLEAGVRVEYQVVEGMAHWFPEDLDVRLDNFL